MGTILFNEIVFGPIKSRRLGLSLGVNILPLYGKLCNFDCIYCECGLNSKGRGDTKIPTLEEIELALEKRLKGERLAADKIDTITFSGNGEPTLHPKFAQIIETTLKLRERYAPHAKISVLTNGSRVGEEEIKRALLSIDNAIIKIDSPFDESVERIDRPLFKYSTERLIKNLESYRGKFILQTLFLRGVVEGELIDNTTEREVEAWYKVVEKIEPKEIMIYTIDRETAIGDLEKVSVQEMERIASPLRERGYKVSISG